MFCFQSMCPDGEKSYHRNIYIKMPSKGFFLVNLRLADIQKFQNCLCYKTMAGAVQSLILIRLIEYDEIEMKTSQIFKKGKVGISIYFTFFTLKFTKFKVSRSCNSLLTRMKRKADARNSQAELSF